MPIEFEFRGEWYRVDTPQEVVELKEYLSSHAPPEKEKDSPRDSYAGLPVHGKWTTDLFDKLMEKIGYFEKKFLAALVSVANPIDANAVARLAFPDYYRYEKKRLRRKVERDGLLVLGGIQSGLVRHVRALGLEPFDLYHVHISWRDDRRTRYFTLDPGFRVVAEEQDWPPQFFREALNK